jgi:hypothetical protein
MDLHKVAVQLPVRLDSLSHGHIWVVWMGSTMVGHDSVCTGVVGTKDIQNPTAKFYFCREHHSWKRKFGVRSRIFYANSEGTKKKLQ